MKRKANEGYGRCFHFVFELKTKYLGEIQCIIADILSSLMKWVKNKKAEGFKPIVVSRFTKWNKIFC